MLTWIACAAAALCLLYYAAIVVYAGFSVSFSWFWLVAAAFFALVAWESRYGYLHGRRLPLWISVPVATFCAACAAIFCAVGVLVFLGAAVSDTPGLDYVIVLGARVHPQGVSNSLRKRLDKAIEYSRENPGTVFILSGGQGSDEPMSEARAMYDYMTDKGVPGGRLVLEEISSSTVENLAYSKVIIDRLEQEREERTGRNPVSRVPGPFLVVEARPIQVGVLTSSYHVFRARRIAEKWGLKNVHGISAESDLILFPHLCVRECIAILKDQLMGNM